MEQLDRLGWATGIVFRSYGRAIAIRVTEPDVTGQILDLLPPGHRQVPSPIVDRVYSVVVGGAGPRPGIRRFHLLYADDLQVTRSFDFDDLLADLDGDLRLYIAEFAR